MSRTSGEEGTIDSQESETLSCGVDLGGTKIVIALVTRFGEVLARDVIRDHRGLSEDQIVQAVADRIRLLLGQNSGVSVPGVAVGTAGHVDFHRGVLISNSNLPGFVDFPLAERMHAAVGLPVFIDNDTNAQAYGEYCFGAGRGHDNMAFVTVSTGLGAGIIIGGKIYRGATGTAGEIGHTIVNPASTIQCGCGNHGCLMAHASGLSLPAVVRHLASTGGYETAVDLESIPDGRITGEFVKEHFDAGDPLFEAIVFEYADYLGMGLHNLVQSICPGLIVIGGGLTGWGPRYLDRVRQTYERWATVTISNPPEIRLWELGEDAAVIGAAAIATMEEAARE